MSFGRATRGRMDGTNIQDRREMRERQKENRQSCAILNDGSIVLVRNLSHQVQLAQGGDVKRFAWMDEVAPESGVEVDGTKGLFEHCKDDVCAQCDPKLKKMCCAKAWHSYTHPEENT